MHLPRANLSFVAHYLYLCTRNLKPNTMDDILHDQNDINESTRAQLDAISTALAELQAKEPPQRPHRKIGFV